MSMQNAFSFDFSTITVGDNPVNDFPVDVPLPARITGVEYRDMNAKKQTTEKKIRLVISQQVWFGQESGTYETYISEKQGYLLKAYLGAVGIGTKGLDNQPLDAESLAEVLVGHGISITFQDREWEGKSFRNVKRVGAINQEEVPSDDYSPF